MPLDTQARREGRAAMERVLENDPAARVRRRLKAGRPRTKEKLSVYEAMQIFTDQAQKARDLMRQEGLSPDNIQTAMVYVLPETGKLGVKLLPPPAQARSFLEFFFGLAEKTPVQFLGIWWKQQTHNPDAPAVTWITQLSGGEQAARLMLQARTLLLPRA